MIDYKKLISEMDERGMPVAALAEVARLDGIRFASRTKLNQAFQDQNAVPLKPETAEQIVKLWVEIMGIQFWCYVAGVPFKLDFRDGAQVHEWLMMLRERARLEQQEQRVADLELQQGAAQL